MDNSGREVPSSVYITAPL